MVRTRTRQTDVSRPVEGGRGAAKRRPAEAPGNSEPATVGFDEVGLDEPLLPTITVILQELAHAMDDLRAEVRNQSRGQWPTMSIEDACAMLGCKKRRLAYLLKEGSLESARRVGRERRITKASVERLLNQRSKGRKRRTLAADEPARLEDIPIFER